MMEEERIFYVIKNVLFKRVLLDSWVAIFQQDDDDYLTLHIHPNAGGGVTLLYVADTTRRTVAHTNTGLSDL